MGGFRALRAMGITPGVLHLNEGHSGFAVLDAIRPEDEPGAVLVAQSDDVPGPYSGPYEAGGVWAVLEGAGTVAADGVSVEVDHPGAYELIRHPVSTAGTLALAIDDGVICHAVCFTPGLAP